MLGQVDVSLSVVTKYGVPLYKYIAECEAAYYQGVSTLKTMSSTSLY